MLGIVLLGGASVRMDWTGCERKRWWSTGGGVVTFGWRARENPL